MDEQTKRVLEKLKTMPVEVHKSKYVAFVVQSKCSRWDWQDHRFPTKKFTEARDEYQKLRDSKIKGFKFRVIRRTVTQIDERMSADG